MKGSFLYPSIFRAKPARIPIRQLSCLKSPTPHTPISVLDQTEQTTRLCGKMLGVPKPVVCNFYAAALFCALAFAFFCAHLRVSASGRVQNDRVWELRKIRPLSHYILWGAALDCSMPTQPPYQRRAGRTSRALQWSRHRHLQEVLESHAIRGGDRTSKTLEEALWGG